MIVDCEDQVCRLLLEKAPDGHAETRAIIGDALKRVATSKDDDDLGDIRPIIEGLAAHLERVEAERADTVLGILKTLAPEIVDWNDFGKNKAARAAVMESIRTGQAFAAIIDSEIRRAHDAVGVPIPSPIPQWMRDALTEHFRYPFEFEVTMLNGVAEFGWTTSKKGRRNSVWDAQIAFNAGQPIKDSGVITLVTDDPLFHKVAEAVAQKHVLRLAAYLKARGLGVSAA